MEKGAAPGRIAPAGCEITLLIPAASFVSTPFPAETAIFCIYRLPRQYLTGARRSTRLRGDVEMRIFRAAFRHVLMDRSRKSSLKESIAGVDSSRISALCGPKDETASLSIVYIKFQEENKRFNNIYFKDLLRYFIFILL